MLVQDAKRTVAGQDGRDERQTSLKTGLFDRGTVKWTEKSLVGPKMTSSAVKRHPEPRDSTLMRPKPFTVYFTFHRTATPYSPVPSLPYTPCPRAN